MADNLEQVEQDIDTFIDANGAPQSIKASNHNNLLKQVLSKTGKYVGSSYVAQKEIVGELSNGQFSFEGNGLNPSSEVTFAFAQLNADNLDMLETFKRLTPGTIIFFKDYAGRAAQFSFKSFTFNATRKAYIVTVENFDGNPEYTYQDDESRVCVFSYLIKGLNFQVLNGAEFRVHSNSDALQIDDVVTNGFFPSEGANGVLIQYAIYKNTIGDNDVNNFGTLAGNFNDGNYSNVKPVKF